MTAEGFAHLRTKLGRLSQSQVDEINFLVGAFDDDKAISYAQAAYMLATVWHETNRTLLPIVEIGKGKGRVYGTWYKNSKDEQYCFKNGRRDTAYLRDDFPHLYYGRGYVQLTWFDNYEKAGKKLNVDFLHSPDLVMDKTHAVQILIAGMKQGWFTGKRLDDYIRQSKKDYVNARRIINGTDKASKIADYADTFEYALRRP